MIELLAITPPSGLVDPNIVDAWLDSNLRQRRFAVLLRQPGASPEDILAPGGRLNSLVRRCQRAEIDLFIGCDSDALNRKVSKYIEAMCRGVQLRGDPSVGDLQQARERWPRMLLGRSCHGLPQPGHGLVDYTCLAPIFAPRTVPGTAKLPVGLGALGSWARDDEAWIVALGGIDPGNAEACMRAGARGLASIRTFFGDPHAVAEDVRALCAALEHRDVPPPTR